MLVVRLAKKGQKGTPVYQLIVADRDAKLRGRYVEKLGTYRLHHGKKVFDIKTDRYEYWLSKGAQASETVKTLSKAFLKQETPAV